MNRRPPAWTLALAAIPVVTTAYYLLVAHHMWAGAQVALYASANGVFGLSSLAVATRNRDLRPIMLVLALGALLGAGADILFYFLALVQGEVAYPSLADVGYLGYYPLVTAGLLMIVRRRTPGWDGASVIDAAIVAVGAGYLGYEFLIAPTVSDLSLPNLVSAAYPLGDLMLIIVGARLLLGAGPRSPSLYLIAGWLGTSLYADIMYTTQTLQNTYTPANYLDAFWIAGAFMVAAAMLHPSATQMISPSRTTTPDATPARLAILAVAAITAPTSLLIQYARGGEPHVVAAGLACNALFLLVLARMAGLVRAQRLAAITDGLTGLRSRRYFEETLRHEVDRADKHGEPLGLLLLDIDHFKRVNDTYGHGGGDRVLIEVTHRLSELVRPGDLAARYGGEEFAMLLPGAGPEETLEVAERIRRGVAAAPIAVSDGVLCNVTVSVGAAGVPSLRDLDELVLAADRALYAAKGAGRDRVAAAA
jgi:two-component system cell cycle response regulator